MAIRPRVALLGAGACLVLLALVWFGAAHVGFFRHADQSGFLQFYDLRDHGAVVWLAHHFVGAFDPNPYVYLVMVPLVVALLRGRPRVVLAIGAIVLAANGTTELLKHVLVSPRPGEFVPGSAISAWPSGHSTAAMSLALVCVLAVPARLRPAAAALGASLAIAVGYSVLAAGLHHPSDVLGGYLVAAAWTGLAVAGLSLNASPEAARRAIARVDWVPALAVLVLVALLAVVGVALVSPDRAFGYLRTHEVMAAAAATIAAAGVAVAGGLALLLRDRTD